MTNTRPAPTHPLSFDNVHAALARTYGDTVHAKRIFSLAGAVVGVLAAGALTVKLVGEALAQARGLADKHAVKQVDRLLSNPAFVVSAFAASWVRTTIADERVLWVNLDWTDFDGDDQTMLVASLQTGRGRSMPLLWRTATKSTLKGTMHGHIVAILEELRRAIPDDRCVTIVADRGFGDRSIYAEIVRLRFDFVIRFRSNILVTSWEGETRPARDWFRGTGKMRSLLGASVTADEARVGKVLVLRERGMAGLWCLAVSDPNIDNTELKRRYGLRFEIEETFRDLKDPRLGMGWLDGRTKDPARRDRMMLLGVIALGLLTLLGMAGEAAGIDKVLKVNTSKQRTLSLVRQGYRWFQLIPTMPEERLVKLLDAFYDVVRGHQAFNLLLLREAE